MATLYAHATAEPIRDITDAETDAYFERIKDDPVALHTGAIDGAMFGFDGLTVYAM